jgi:hypothetical protein
MQTPLSEIVIVLASSSTCADSQVRRSGILLEQAVDRIRRVGDQFAQKYLLLGTGVNHQFQ